MDRYQDRSLTQLQRHALMRIVPGLGKGVAVYSGSAWITQDADPADHVLGPGDTMPFTTKGLVIIEALEATNLVLFDTSPLAPPEDSSSSEQIARVKPSIERIEREARAMRRQAIARAACAVFGAMRRLFRAIRRIADRRSGAVYRRPYHAPLTLRDC